MKLNLHSNKHFQQFQHILNSRIHPQSLYCANPNILLQPAYTPEANQFFTTQHIIQATQLIPFF
ncbi:hypothetical protein [Staphylococcus capitis]|uniref:hypothetical protein n=1 Tax=Staphylococcus capitis TaxID=29388 RepID=UPI0011A649BB|nr:hypothetical protein [Staphylococcus capitis]